MHSVEIPDYSVKMCQLCNFGRVVALYLFIYVLHEAAERSHSSQFSLIEVAQMVFKTKRLTVLTGDCINLSL